MEADLTAAALAWFAADALLHMDMSQALRRGHGTVIAADWGGVLLREERSGVCMLSSASVQDSRRLIAGTDLGDCVCLHQAHSLEAVAEAAGLPCRSACLQAVWPGPEPMEEPGDWDIRVLGPAWAGRVWEDYHNELGSYEEILWQTRQGHILGAFDGDGELLGFIGMHPEGALGILTVRPRYRRRGVASALMRRAVNRALTLGETPYGQVFEDNAASLALQRRLGMRLAGGRLWWLWR